VDLEVAYVDGIVGDIDDVEHVAVDRCSSSIRSG